MKKKLGVHACWLDRDCRKVGVPAYTYFFCWWFTLRINPPHDRLLDAVAGKKVWDWRVIQVWRNR